jgi:DNA-directed RNA polymerase specialized sigma subunit
MSPAPLDGPRRDLVERFRPLALALAADACPPASRGSDDARSAAMLGLVEAAARLDEARGRSFKAFARTRIRWALAGHFRGLRPLGYRRGKGRASAPLVLPLSALGPRD